MAFDLARDEFGNVIPGPETQICLRRASHEALHCPDHVLVVSAGIASKEWDKCWMGQVMRKYINQFAPEVNVIAVVGETFNTSGEMKAFAHVVEGYASMDKRDPQVNCIVVVKWWHAWRSKLLCRYWLKKKGLGNAALKVIECESLVSPKYIACEWLLHVPNCIMKKALGRL